MMDNAARWLTEGRLSKSTGLIIAPVDFTTEVKNFFTFDERFSFAPQFPEGWRPMTVTEAWAIVEEFTAKGGNGDPNRKFLGMLGFALTGYIFPGMDRYNEDPSDDNVRWDLIQDSSLETRIWVDGPADKSFAPALCLKRFKKPQVENFARAAGHRIRLVYPIKDHHDHV